MNHSNTGAIQKETDFTPYGGEVVVSGSDSNHFKFAGKERDETGLDNFGARFYDSNFGRFMTPDWAARPTTVPYASFGDPQTLNLYTYVENAPVNRADEDGHGEFYCGHDGDWCDGGESAQQQRIDSKKIQEKNKAATDADKQKKAAQNTYSIQVVGADGKRHNVALPVGSQVLVMTQQAHTDPITGALMADVTYQVNNVGENGLTPETKATEVFLKEKTTAGDNCNAGCSNKSVPSNYDAAKTVDHISTRWGPSFQATQQFFIGTMKASPALLLREIPRAPGMFDLGTGTHVTATHDAVSIGLEP